MAREIEKPRSPVRWAIDISLVLNAALGADRFPVDVPLVAKEYSVQLFPKDPISIVVGDSLPGFDGALFPAPSGKVGWGIFYNKAISSPGRINFTLAHEFGHYLVHRLAYPKGIQCGDQDFVCWESEYGQIEHQANVFAANLLMPLDDYRRQIPADERPDLGVISGCAERYRVSLIAAILRWLDYTTRRAILVVSRDGFIMWARSSEKAFRTGALIRTKNLVVPVPAQSLAAKQDKLIDGRNGIDLAEGIWLRENVREMTIFADNYDFVISLLLLPDSGDAEWREEETEDTFDRFNSRR